jgi:hypothetical protein
MSTSQDGSWLSAIEGIPFNIASTIGGLANWLITPPGYTQGGAPLAGGQFPNNYPFTQAGINKVSAFFSCSHMVLAGITVSFSTLGPVLLKAVPACAAVVCWVVRYQLGRIFP